MCEILCFGFETLPRVEELLVVKEFLRSIPSYQWHNNIHEYGRLRAKQMMYSVSSIGYNSVVITYVSMIHKQSYRIKVNLLY